MAPTAAAAAMTGPMTDPTTAAARRPTVVTLAHPEAVGGADDAGVDAAEAAASVKTSGHR